MSEFAIEVKDLTKTYRLYSNNKRRIVESLLPTAKPTYKEYNALNHVSFSIKKGEIVGIIGRNGSGKSTLLKIITGVLYASGGMVNVEGRISALLELGAGFNPEYTGIENIYLNGTLNRLSREEVSKRIDDIAEFADIGDFIYQPVKNYSSGMFVRLAFAVAVYSDPDILIVDEALAVGDAAFQAKCMARMNQIMKSGATVLFVTHDMNTVKGLCQRCIYLDHGNMIMEGPAEELADIYLRNMRKSMNDEHIKILANQKMLKEMRSDSVINDSNLDKEEKYADISVPSEYIDEEFVERVRPFTEGTGAVKFIGLQLANEKGEETPSFAFNEKMRMKVRFLVNEDVTFSVAYHIRDDKNIELLGSSIKRETGQLINGKKGEVYEAELISRLPLMDGNYNITLVASTSVVENRTALFLAYIENAAVFSVEENFSAKLWDKVYIKNEVNLKVLNR